MTTTRATGFPVYSRMDMDKIGATKSVDADIQLFCRFYRLNISFGKEAAHPAIINIEANTIKSRNSRSMRGLMIWSPPDVRGLDDDFTLKNDRQLITQGKSRLRLKRFNQALQQT